MLFFLDAIFSLGAPRSSYLFLLLGRTVYVTSQLPRAFMFSQRVPFLDAQAWCVKVQRLGDEPGIVSGAARRVVSKGTRRLVWCRGHPHSALSLI